MSCPPHTSTCPHRSEYAAQLRASVAARKQRLSSSRSVWPTLDVAPQQGALIGDDPMSESSDESEDDPPPVVRQGECRSVQSSTGPVRRSGTTCLVSRTPLSPTPSPPPTRKAQPSCLDRSVPTSQLSSSMFGTQLDAPPKILPGSVEVRSTSPFARRNRYMPLALRKSSHWKPTMPPHGDGEGSASLAKMTLESVTPTRHGTCDERQMEWSD